MGVQTKPLTTKRPAVTDAIGAAALALVRHVIGNTAILKRLLCGKLSRKGANRVELIQGTGRTRRKGRHVARHFYGTGVRVMIRPIGITVGARKKMVLILFFRKLIRNRDIYIFTKLNT